MNNLLTQQHQTVKLQQIDLFCINAKCSEEQSQPIHSSCTPITTFDASGKSCS